MTLTAARPRVLLVEDDPVTRAFLAAAVEALPAMVDCADSVAAAVAVAGLRPYDLWLFDANLPDGRGDDLLAKLRGEHPDVPAIAHTADIDAGTVDALLGAGFQTVLVKPLPAAAVQAAISEVLATAFVDQAPVLATITDWDDAAAARALNGSHEHLAALRKLFLAELPAVHQRVSRSIHESDIGSLRAELHRLRASCGFVGAIRLQEVVRALDREHGSALLLPEFTAAVRALGGEVESPATTAVPEA